MYRVLRLRAARNVEEVKKKVEKDLAALAGKSSNLSSSTSYQNIMDNQYSRLVEVIDIEDKSKKYLTPFLASKKDQDSPSYMYVATMSEMFHIVSSILTEQHVLAVDIENSSASYEGFICLIQFAYFCQESKEVKGFVFDIIEIMADCKMGNDDVAN